MADRSIARPVRCAIYTRKSLARVRDDEQSSLDVQRALCVDHQSFDADLGHPPQAMSESTTRKI